MILVQCGRNGSDIFERESIIAGGGGGIKAFPRGARYVAKKEESISMIGGIDYMIGRTMGIVL
jgi:hypothetical protein